MMRQRIAAVLVAALGLAGGAAAWAQADPEDPHVQNTQAQAQAQEDGDEQAPPAEGRRRGKPGRHVLGRAIHGDLIVRGEDGAWENVAVDRGTVTNITESSIEIERPDGQKVTAALDDNTRYGPDRDRTDIQTGQPAMVVQKDGKAVAVLQKDPDRQRQRPPRGDGPPAAYPGSMPRASRRWASPRARSTS